MRLHIAGAARPPLARPASRRGRLLCRPYGFPVPASTTPPRQRAPRPVAPKPVTNLARRSSPPRSSISAWIRSSYTRTDSRDHGSRGGSGLFDLLDDPAAQLLFYECHPGRATRVRRWPRVVGPFLVVEAPSWCGRRGGLGRLRATRGSPARWLLPPGRRGFRPARSGRRRAGRRHCAGGRRAGRPVVRPGCAARFARSRFRLRQAGIRRARDGAQPGRGPAWPP